MKQSLLVLALIGIGFASKAQKKQDTAVKQKHDTLQVIVITPQFVQLLQDLVNKSEAPHTDVNKFWEMLTPKNNLRVVVDGKLQ